MDRLSRLYSALGVIDVTAFWLFILLVPGAALITGLFCYGVIGVIRRETSHTVIFGLVLVFPAPAAVLWIFWSGSVPNMWARAFGVGT